MDALQVRPRTNGESAPDRIDELSRDAAGLSARSNRRTLERRLKGRKRIENRDAFEDVRPRSDEGVAHFELIFRPTGRDVYRFTAW